MRDPVHTQADASVGPEPPETVTSKLIDEDFAELSDYEDFVMIMNGRLGKLLLSLSRECCQCPMPFFVPLHQPPPQLSHEPFAVTGAFPVVVAELVLAAVTHTV